MQAETINQLSFLHLRPCGIQSLRFLFVIHCISFTKIINISPTLFCRYESGDWAQRTDWHRIVVFKPQLREAVMEFLKKGQRTMVQGKITYGEITDNEGKPRMSTSIIADDVIFFKERA